MQCNKSSRRRFFGKTLAFFGAAFACSKAAAASASTTVPVSTPTLPTGCHHTFYQYDAQGYLDWEGGVTSYYYPESEDYSSGDLTQHSSYQCNADGSVTFIEYRKLL